MVAAVHPAPWAIEANEGHVADILLLLAMTFVLAESDEALPVTQMARVLLAAGYPACNPDRLASTMKSLLRAHPERFTRLSTGWTLAAEESSSRSAA